MENFARLFILRIRLRDSPLGNRGKMPTNREKWRSVDRLIALYGPPDVINHAWTTDAPWESDLDQAL